MGIVWGQSGFLMLRGYAEIVTHSGPTRCEVCKAWVVSEAGGVVGGSRGDDFCVPPQHEESRLPPATPPEQRHKSKNRPRAVLGKKL